MIASRKNSSPARLKAHSFARWLVLGVFLAAATNGSALAKLHAPTSTSELVAGEREAAIQYNFASNYNEQTDPELANALALTSGILGLVDLGASFSGVKNLANSTNKASDALQLINKSETALSLNHSERVTALVNKLEQGTHADVVATLSSVKAREFVEEVLEIERSAAQKAGKTDVVEQLDDALDVVRGTEKIKTIDELKAFLVTIDEMTTIEQLEEKGIKSFFRGTTRSKADNSLFPGNPNSQAFGISTSTDPIKATIFSIESATSNGAYNGVLQIGLPNDLRSLSLNSPNIYRCEKELEVVIQTAANNFASLSKVEISAENARRLVKEVYGIDLPSKIYSTGLNNSDELLETIPASSLEKAFEFYQKALQYNQK